MKLYKRILTLAFSLALTFSLTACGGNTSTPAETPNTPTNQDSAEENWPEVTLVLGHAMSEDSVINDDALWLKESIEKATKGTVTVEIYPGSQLGNEVQMFEGMMTGTVDIMLPPPSIIVSFIEDFGVFDLPYLVRGYDHACAIWESEIGQDLTKQLNEKGIQCYGIADFGFRNATNNVRPIETPADVKGLKMRTMTSEVALALWEQLGATPVAMAINEVFSALQTNVIDGQENPYTAIQSNGFYEVQKYCSATQHQYNFLNIVVSDQALAKMADGQKEAFISAFEGAGAASKEFMDKRSADSIAFMEEKGMQFNDCDLEAFVEAAQPVIDQFADKYGADKIELIQSLVP